MSKPLIRLSSRRISSTEWDGAGRAGVQGKKGSFRSRSLPPVCAGRCAEGTEQKNRVRNKLKRLIAKRPTLQSLQERGLFRGRLGWT